MMDVAIMCKGLPCFKRSRCYCYAEYQARYEQQHTETEPLFIDAMECISRHHNLFIKKKRGGRK